VINIINITKLTSLLYLHHSLSLPLPPSLSPLLSLLPSPPLSSPSTLPSRSLSVISQSNRPYIPPQIDLLSAPVRLLYQTKVREKDRERERERDREKEQEREQERERERERERDFIYLI
jgi:hypothetical protein